VVGIVDIRVVLLVLLQLLLLQHVLFLLESFQILYRFCHSLIQVFLVDWFGYNGNVIIVRVVIHGSLQLDPSIGTVTTSVSEVVMPPFFYFSTNVRWCTTRNNITGWKFPIEYQNKQKEKGDDSTKCQELSLLQLLQSVFCHPFLLSPFGVLFVKAITFLQPARVFGPRRICGKIGAHSRHHRGGGRGGDTFR